MRRRQGSLFNSLKRFPSLSSRQILGASYADRARSSCAFTEGRHPCATRRGQVCAFTCRPRPQAPEKSGGPSWGPQGPLQRPTLSSPTAARPRPFLPFLATATASLFSDHQSSKTQLPSAPFRTTFLHRAAPADQGGGPRTAHSTRIGEKSRSPVPVGWQALTPGEHSL